MANPHSTSLKLMRGHGYSAMFAACGETLSLADHPYGQTSNSMFPVDLQPESQYLLLKATVTCSNLFSADRLTIADGHTASGEETAPALLELIDLMAFDDTHALWMWSGEVFSNAPQLCSVCLVGVFMEDIPWQQLTDLCIGKIILSDVLNILSHCVKLRCLRLPRGFVTEADLAYSSSSTEGSTDTSPEPEEENLAPKEGSFFGGTPQSKITLADLQEVEVFDPEILRHLHAPSSKTLTINATLVFDPDATLNNFTTLSNFFISCSTI
ncbi:hypothetical protein IW261DRAFT_1422816 [Armillaria novae-zelandiae]|uniref:Uncharacterized protein n=1 Tax=Armillaria novae-zelandiae TaxID=153914 RepID=A0AA39U547_9AGAR|nr:hypothetical protein IW261DRAFT_1422816 [Armillaria novae-zelandiae]